MEENINAQVDTIRIILKNICQMQMESWQERLENFDRVNWDSFKSLMERQIQEENLSPLDISGILALILHWMDATLVD